MAIQFSDGTLEFTQTIAGEATATSINVFSAKVKTVHAAVMRGFDIVFDNGEHSVVEFQAQVLGTSIDPVNAAVVHVNGVLFWRGNTDEPYHGIIDYTVIAEV